MSSDDIDNLTAQLEAKCSVKEINKGTGAGGANTNKNGKTFEEKTSIEPLLLEKGFVSIFFSTEFVSDLFYDRLSVKPFTKGLSKFKDFFEPVS